MNEFMTKEQGHSFAQRLAFSMTKVQDSTFAQPQAARQGDAQGWAS